MGYVMIKEAFEVVKRTMLDCSKRAVCGWFSGEAEARVCWGIGRLGDSEVIVVAIWTTRG